jgi:hypothetical protein
MAGAMASRYERYGRVLDGVLDAVDQDPVRTDPLPNEEDRFDQAPLARPISVVDFPSAHRSQGAPGEANWGTFNPGDG